VDRRLNDYEHDSGQPSNEGWAALKGPRGLERPVTIVATSYLCHVNCLALVFHKKSDRGLGRLALPKNDHEGLGSLIVEEAEFAGLPNQQRAPPHPHARDSVTEWDV
jgi:hypothetical protein